MALDATVGGISADTYGTVAEADAYFTARGITSWHGNTGSKEQDLRKAATYLDNMYMGRWKGLRVNRDQARAWPRSYAIDSDGYSFEADTIPQAVKNAQFEIAYLYHSGDNPLTTIDRSVKSESIGEISVTYMDSASLQAQYPQVTVWLTDLVTGGAGVNSSWGSGKVIRS